MRRKIIKIVLVFCMVSFCVMGGRAVFAADGAIIPGNNPTNGGCNWSGVTWWDTCFGLSWQKYKVIKDLPEDGVYFYYTSNTGTPIAIRGCKEGQYVYNYGLEVHEGYNSTGYQVSTQRNKNLTQAPHNSVARGAYGSTVSEYLEVVGYATMAEAKDSYEKMVKYIETHPDFSYVGNLGFGWENVGAFCYSDEADGSEFEGKTEVTGAATKTVGYTNETQTEFATINNCSATDGCKVSFKHSLKRTSGDGSIEYTVARSSNFIETSSESRAIAANSKVKTGTFDSNEAQVSSSGEWTLYPGMVVCEKLEFSPNDREPGKVYTRVCARALGSVKTSLDIKVKNNTVAKFGNYSSEIYAKPDDEVTYQAGYNPLTQYTRRIRPETMKINNGAVINNGKPCATVVSSSGLLGYCQLAVLYNGKKGSTLADWNNGFTVSSEGFSYLSDYQYELGDITGKVESNNYNILKTDVGNELVEKAETNKSDTLKTTPKTVSFAAGTDKVATADVNVAASLDMGSVLQENGEVYNARVYVPYNFINSTNIVSIDKTVYAGEKVGIDYEIITDLKPNDELGDTYATMVKNAKWRIEVCYGDNYENCYTDGDGGGDLHKNEDIWKSSTKNDEGTKANINVPDLPAGTKIRMRSAVYPSNSGGDGNWQDAEGSHEWAHSAWVEFVIAKKPSFQVWGGSVYSANDIDLLVSEKQHINGYNDFKEIVNSEDNFTYVFGAWTELGLMASGAVTGLASGAGTGYTQNDGGVLIANPGGSKEKFLDFCLRSTLSFANVNCKDNVGNLGGSVVDTYSREDLISRFNDTEDSEYTLEIHDNPEGGVYDIYGGVIDKRVTKVITVRNGTARINGRIEYNNDGYTELAQIPKLIIYAENIDILCGVDRIDAVLIARNEIKTCVDAGGNDLPLNSRARSAKLQINGSVITDILNLGRTYGAATGDKSIEPAEVINYDSSLYLWTSKQSDITKTGKVITTYQHELSPRY